VSETCLISCLILLSGSYPKNLRTNPDFEVVVLRITLVWKTNTLRLH